MTTTDQTDRLAVIGLLIVLALLASVFRASLYFNREVHRQASARRDDRALRWTAEDDRALTAFLDEARQ